MPDFPMPPDWVRRALRDGIVIPAHPLALTAARQLDERRQRALTRYYHAAGAGGMAVGVHTTQFAIRDPKHGLFRPVLQLAADTIAACDSRGGRRTVRIAGICGATEQAIGEAIFARETGFHIGLLSFAALKAATDDGLIAHAEQVAREIPLFGFYLQPAVGGRVLSREFWRRFVAIPNVAGIKIAPFNRYQTLDVIHALVAADRAEAIPLYTGNDDNIVIDLLTEFRVGRAGEATPGGDTASVRIVGGLLGHWACWTKRAVELLESLKHHRRESRISADLLALAAQVTDSNAALFDAAHQFAGCIAGIHEVLRRQGLLEGIWCLDPHETLSSGQAAEIDRVCRAYPHLTDDEFVRAHLDEWLGGD